MKKGKHTGVNTPRLPPDGCKTLDLPSFTVCAASMNLFRLVIPIQRKVGILKVNGRILQPIWREIDEPVQTITTRKEHIGIQEEGSEEKPVKIRSLNIKETLTLQGFNPNYNLSTVKTMKSKWTLVGNAVCPPVARAIIEGIQNG